MQPTIIILNCKQLYHMDSFNFCEKIEIWEKVISHLPNYCSIWNENCLIVILKIDILCTIPLKVCSNPQIHMHFYLGETLKMQNEWHCLNVFQVITCQFFSSSCYILSSKSIGFFSIFNLTTIKSITWLT